MGCGSAVYIPLFIFRLLGILGSCEYYTYTERILLCIDERVVEIVQSPQAIECDLLITMS